MGLNRKEKSMKIKTGKICPYCQQEIVKVIEPGISGQEKEQCACFPRSSGRSGFSACHDR